MTKPIEGWMAQAVHHPDLISRVFATAEEAAEHYQITGKTSQWKVRPVRITFTDEQEEVSHLPPNIKSISDFNAMPEADKETYFDSTFGPLPSDIVADAIRKDRERIWEELVIRFLDPHPPIYAEENRETFFTLMYDFKRAIFGEEK